MKYTLVLTVWGLPKLNTLCTSAYSKPETTLPLMGIFFIVGIK